MTHPIFLNRQLPNNPLTRCGVGFHGRFSTRPEINHWFLCELVKRIVMLVAATVIYPTLCLFWLCGRRVEMNNSSSSSTSNVFSRTLTTPSNASTSSQSTSSPPSTISREITVPKLPESTQEIEPIILTEEALEKVRDILDTLDPSKKEDKFSYLKYNFCIFPKCEEYYNTVENNRQILKQNNLDRLVILPLKLLKIKSRKGTPFTLLVRWIGLNVDFAKQKDYFIEQSKEVIPLLKQLTTYIALCGVGEHKYFHANFPVVFENLPKMLVFRDLKMVEKNPYKDIYDKDDGIVNNCRSVEQLDAVVQKAKELGIKYDEAAAKVVDDLREELEKAEKIKKFHEKLGVSNKNPIKPIEVNFKTLGVKKSTPLKNHLMSGKPSFNLNQVVTDIVNAINAEIAKNENSTLLYDAQRKRQIYLDTSAAPLKTYMDTKIDDKQSWFDYAANLLVTKEYLYVCKRMQGENSYSYYIQA